MNLLSIDPLLVFVLLLNFFCLATTRLRRLIYAVAAQGVLLGFIYLFVHQGPAPEGVAQDVIHYPGSTRVVSWHLLRHLGLTVLLVGLKGFLIPRLLLRAMRGASTKSDVECLFGVMPVLVLGFIGTGLTMAYAAALPLKEEHASNLLVPTSLATVFVGFLILMTRRRALTQVLGYLVLENGIFVFGLLLIEAMPILVELGVLLDLFVGVFVMGIIIHHVNREFPAASSEHMSVLRE